MKRFRGIFAVIAVVMLFSSNITAFAQEEENNEPKTIKTVQGLFNEQRSLGKHIIEQIKAKTGTVYFEAKEFVIYMEPEDMGYTEKGPARYSMDLIYDTKPSKNVEKKLIYDTPYNIVEISNKDGLPGKVTYKLKDTSFYPGTTVHLYSLSNLDKDIELVMNDITVSPNCEISFSIQNQGRYLITADHPGTTANPYAFERPILVNFEDLITTKK